MDSGIDDADLKARRRHERTGRPLGNDDFITRLEGLLDRVLRPIKRGPKGGAIIK